MFKYELHLETDAPSIPNNRPIYQEESYAKCGRCGSCSYLNTTTNEFRDCYCRYIGKIWIMLPSIGWHWDKGWKGVAILWGIGYLRDKSNFHFKKSFFWKLGIGNNP